MFILDPAPPCVLFLGVEGVLNSDAHFVSISRSKKPRCDDPEYWAITQISPHLVELLDEIVSQTGAVVVVADDWRELQPVESLQRILERLGFTGRVIGATPWLRTGRASEVRTWLEFNAPQSRFVVLDGDDGPDPPVECHVRVDGRLGLREIDVQRVVGMLM